MRRLEGKSLRFELDISDGEPEEGDEQEEDHHHAPQQREERKEEGDAQEEAHHVPDEEDETVERDRWQQGLPNHRQQVEHIEEGEKESQVLQEVAAPDSLREDHELHPG